MKRNNIVKPEKNYSPPILDILRESLRGYKRLFCRLVWIALALAATAISGFFIVFPLWYLSARHKDLYGLLSLLVLFSTGLFYCVKKVRDGVENAGGLRGYGKNILLPRLRKILVLSAAALGLYGILFLFAKDLVIPGIVGAVLYVVFLGTVLSSRRESL